MWRDAEVWGTGGRIVDVENVNVTWEKGKVSDDWKTCVTVPVHKGNSGDRDW